MKAVIDTRFLVTHFLTPDDKTKKWTKTTLESLQKGFIKIEVVDEDNPREDQDDYTI